MHYFYRLAPFVFRCENIKWLAREMLNPRLWWVLTSCKEGIIVDTKGSSPGNRHCNLLMWVPSVVANIFVHMFTLFVPNYVGHDGGLHGQWIPQNVIIYRQLNNSIIKNHKVISWVTMPLTIQGFRSSYNKLLYKIIGESTKLKPAF